MSKELKLAKYIPHAFVLRPKKIQKTRNGIFMLSSPKDKLFIYDCERCQSTIEYESEVPLKNLNGMYGLGFSCI